MFFIYNHLNCVFIFNTLHQTELTSDILIFQQNEISTPRPSSKEDEKTRKEISEEERLKIEKEKEIKKEKIQKWKVGFKIFISYWVDSILVLGN